MELQDIRKEIDRENEGILKLFLERMENSGKVAEYKKSHGLPVLNPEREREILKKVQDESGDMELYAYQLFRTIMELSRAYQNRILETGSEETEKIKASVLPGDSLFPKTGTIAVIGTEGSFSEQAAKRMFPRGSTMFLKSFSGVFDAVESGLCDYGIVPVENSSYGSVREVYKLFQERDLTIMRSIKVNVHHELLAKPGTALKDIKEVISHDQALGQCEEFLKTLPGVKLTKVANTATAAKMVAESERKDVASISSHQAGIVNGLKSIETDIMDSANNYTRFVCISRKPAIYPGSNRISLILQIAHEPGALYNVLSEISALGLNLVKLESVPIVGHDFEFIFYVDIEGSVLDPGVPELLATLQSTCDYFKFLGNYPVIG